MSGYSVWNGSAWVAVGAGGDASDQFPGKPQGAAVSSATSAQSTITATASATPHTAGSWVEVVPSLSSDKAALRLFLNTATAASGADSSTLLEIGTGAGGAETVWATVGIGYISTIYPIVVPGFLASGTRVAVRARSAVASQNVVGWYSFAEAKSTPLAAPTTFGANTATSRGVTLTPHASLNTKGAWTEITSAGLATGIDALCISPQAAAGTAMNSSGVLLDVGYGPNSSTVTTIAEDLYLQGSSNENYTARSPLVVGVSVAAGQRLWGRYQRASTANAVDLILVGA